MKITTTLLLIVCFCRQSFAQSVSLSNDGSQPHPSAILDLKSSNKGILLPRVSLTSTVDSITIPHPEKSLLVFNNNEQLETGLGFYAWAGDHWELILSVGNKFVKGENRFLIMVDGISREFYVNVPESYNDTVKTPVVFMLHGTGATGKKFYKESGWVELGNEQGFITVFPTSQTLHVIDDGLAKWTTKWNVFPDVDWTFYPGASGKDDIKFFKKIIQELKSRFNVDTSRIYMDGFSSGGQMASKCAIEMSDIFAAIVSNAASFKLDTIYVPKRKLPVMFQLGNKDYGHGVHLPQSPMSHFEASLNDPNMRNGFVARAHVRNFGLHPVYTITGDTNSVRIATYSSLTGDTLNFFKFVYIKELGHKYPTEENFEPETYNLNIIACKDHWAWFKLYRKP
jgi:poly(3-hydroxybutyrate) depolymerase